MISQIVHECSDFLKESDGNMLYKCLPKTTASVCKIKLRRRGYKSQVDKFVDMALRGDDVRKRSLIAYTGVVECNDENSLYYTFPVNGYSYIYNENVWNLTKEYGDTISSLPSNGSNETSIISLQVLQEVIKESYQNTKLLSAFNRPCEIMFYDIPYFYAISVDYYEQSGLKVITAVSD